MNTKDKCDEIRRMISICEGQLHLLFLLWTDKQLVDPKEAIENWSNLANYNLKSKFHEQERSAILGLSVSMVRKSLEAEFMGMVDEVLADFGPPDSEAMAKLEKQLRHA